MNATRTILLAVLALFALFIAACSQNGQGAQLDDFAKCLSDKGAKMYGAYWCSHCNSQKEMFGESWQYVDYVECAMPSGGQEQICTDAGVRAYPTWTFQSGQKTEGELTLQQLSINSGCSLT